ncbi:MAG: ribosome assembly RNA-binding protein YhbY [Myxococcales bacterium]|nr:ribosome assembly RNA-binding protein YhbY [Myxococcales bacterium]MCB9645131.1 ribosome assembly RNA-binding protein YhbY [Deltaproteobacteria bacterium]
MARPAAKKKPLEPLTGRQRKHLRGLGHHVEPIVQIGHQGLTDAVAKAVDEALEHHELIKVKVGKNAPDPDRPAIADQLKDRLRCHVVQTMGRVITLYREASDEERRTITLPAVRPDEPEEEE